MTSPSRGINRPASPTTHPTSTGGAPGQVSPAPTCSDWRERLGASFASTLIALALVGCGVPVQDYCRTAVSATVRAVDVSMSVAGELHTAGRISDAAARELVAAHDLYRPIAKAVKTGCDTIASHEDADVEIKRLQKAADALLQQAVRTGRE